MQKLLILALVLCVFTSNSQERRMCITVDDLTAVTYGLNNENKINSGLLTTFEKYDVPAIGYVNEGKLYRGDVLVQSRVDILERWLKAGLDLGNHTYSHVNYHRSTLEEFEADIKKGEEIIKPLALKYNKKIGYFRHPYLRSGSDKASSDALVALLNKLGYREAPVTIDNEEYLFAKAYAIAFKEKDQPLMKKVGLSYLEYMEKQLLYYEKASNDLLGRNMDHTLLIHANLLNAHYLDALLNIYKKYGYQFISQDEVLKDPAYQLEVTRFKDWGISWIHRWGISQGLEGDFFKGEAQTPDFIMELVN